MKERFTNFPTQILDMVSTLSSSELKVISLICRHTLGESRKFCSMSNLFIRAGTGLSKQGVITAIQSLSQMDLIQVSNDGESNRYSLSSNFYSEYPGHLSESNSCFYCGATENLTTDHVIPRSHGGHDALTNFVHCCKTCNSTKNARTPQQWLGGQS